MIGLRDVKTYGMTSDTSREQGYRDVMREGRMASHADLADKNRGCRGRRCALDDVDGSRQEDGLPAEGGLTGRAAREGETQRCRARQPAGYRWASRGCGHEPSYRHEASRTSGTRRRALTPGMAHPRESQTDHVTEHSFPLDMGTNPKRGSRRPHAVPKCKSRGRSSGRLKTLSGT